MGDDSERDLGQHEGEEDAEREGEQPPIAACVVVHVHPGHSDSPRRTAAIRPAWIRTSCSAAILRASALGRGSSAAERKPASIDSALSGSTSTPAPGVTSSAGPPTRVAM